MLKARRGVFHSYPSNIFLTVIVNQYRYSPYPSLLDSLKPNCAEANLEPVQTCNPEVNYDHQSSTEETIFPSPTCNKDSNELGNPVIEERSSANLICSSQYYQYLDTTKSHSFALKGGKGSVAMVDILQLGFDKSLMTMSRVFDFVWFLIQFISTFLICFHQNLSAVRKKSVARTELNLKARMENKFRRGLQIWMSVLCLKQTLIVDVTDLNLAAVIILMERCQWILQMIIDWRILSYLNSKIMFF